MALKIIFVINSLESGGAERVMSILANEFVKLGFDISIISKSHKKPFYELDSRVKLIYPSPKINYKNKLKTLQGRLSVYFHIYKILKKEKPDVVIPFSTTTNGTIIPICKILGLRIIASEHTNHKANNNFLAVRFIKRWIYPRANALTVLTERDKTQFYGHLMKNVVVMPNPLPLKPLETVELLKRSKVILAVGNISRWHIKGFDKLLDIFSIIATEHPDWKLKIAGGGNPEYLNNLIKKNELLDKVELLGEVNNIGSLMKQSSIFVLTSRYEGLPMVLIEAMSQGMACIAFDCFTGPGDIIHHEKDGILVEDQNNKHFATQLSLLIENETIRNQLGVNAIETSKKYLPEKIVAQWQKLIEQTIHPK